MLEFLLLAAAISPGGPPGHDARVVVTHDLISLPLARAQAMQGQRKRFRIQLASPPTPEGKNFFYLCHSDNSIDRGVSFLPGQKVGKGVDTLVVEGKIRVLIPKTDRDLPEFVDIRVTDAVIVR